MVFIHLASRNIHDFTKVLSRNVYFGTDLEFKKSQKFFAAKVWSFMVGSTHLVPHPISTSTLRPRVAAPPTKHPLNYIYNYAAQLHSHLVFENENPSYS